MKDTVTLRFLYHTAPGRAVLHVLVQPWISKIAGCFLSSRLSKPIVPYFIKKNCIDLTDISVPQGGFSSFNDFFTRKRKSKAPDIEADSFISPCDGYLSSARIDENTVLEIKHSGYFVKDLLRDSRLAKSYEGGLALIFRLTPANYHRYCYPVSGKVLASRKIAGKLHCVRPIALSTVPVFIQNSREYQIIKTKTFGTIVQMEVGALLVGKIHNHQSTIKNRIVHAGTEKGYFEFGGSTIIVLFQKDTVCLHDTFAAQLGTDTEIPVRLGDLIAKKMPI